MKKDILVALYELRELAENEAVPFPNYGICLNLANLASNEHLFPDGHEWMYPSCYDYFVESTSRGWEYHTGMSFWPVPRTQCNLWWDTGLQYRLSLLDYLIERVESGEWDFALDSELEELENV